MIFFCLVAGKSEFSVENKHRIIFTNRILFMNKMNYLLGILEKEKTNTHNLIVVNSVSVWKFDYELYLVVIYTMEYDKHCSISHENWIEYECGWYQPINNTIQIEERLWNTSRFIKYVEQPRWVRRNFSFHF